MLLRSRNTKFRPKDYPGFDRVKNMAIAFEAGQYDQQILNFAKQMEQSGKQVHLLGYIPKKRKEVTEFPSYNHFTKTELNWYGKPKSEDVKEFLKPHYGVYSSLNTKNDNPLEFVTAGIGADFSVGLRIPCFTRFDLVLEQQDEDLQKVFREIEYYLNFINKEN